MLRTALLCWPGSSRYDIRFGRAHEGPSPERSRHHCVRLRQRPGRSRDSPAAFTAVSVSNVLVSLCYLVYRAEFTTLGFVLPHMVFCAFPTEYFLPLLWKRISIINVSVTGALLASVFSVSVRPDTKMTSGPKMEYVL